MIPEALVYGLLINKSTVAPKIQTLVLINQFCKGNKHKKQVFFLSVGFKFHI